jgi:pimeloyl-ACP methyl ester carboxylesterase
MSVCRSCDYIEIGSGEQPVVMLHGLFGGPENWRSIMEDLAGSFRCLALQFPIDPKGDRRHTEFDSLARLTQFVEDFFDRVGLDRAVVCGNSLGGQVALDFCLKRPECVDGLVLAGSAGLFERNLAGGRMPRLTRELIRQQACEIFFDPVHVTDDLVEQVYQMLGNRPYRRFLVRVAKATRDRNMQDELGRIGVPTLIIWGRDDSITPPFVAEQFRHGISNAKLMYLDRCGHAPPIEQPEQFARVLERFLPHRGAPAAFAGPTAATGDATRRVLPR